MSKMTDIIDRRIDQKLQAQQQEKHVPCIIESVSDDYLRADVSLLTDRNTIIKSRLNKSGEKLTAGQQAWLYYTTLPSSGYIGRTEGEADPMGGGGGATTVENAAILTDDTFSDYAVDNELIVNLEPDGHIYYGLDTGQVGMCIVQGRYCVWGVSGGKVTYNDGVWTIFGSTNLYNTIIQNIDKLSSQHGNYDENHPELGGGWLFNGVSNKSYPERCKQLEYRIGTATRSAQGISYSANIFIRNYLNDAPTGNWWEEDLTHTTPTSPPTLEHSAQPRGPMNTTYFQDRLTDVVMVPVVASYNPNTSYGGLQTPYGYVDIIGMLIFAQDGSNGWGASYIGYTASLGISDLHMPYTPLISEAEKAFLLGITKKTEPIPGA